MCPASSDDSGPRRIRNLHLERQGHLRFLDIRGAGKWADQKLVGYIDTTTLNPGGWADADKIELLAIRDLEYGTDLSGKSTVVLDRFEALGLTEAAGSPSAPKLRWL